MSGSAASSRPARRAERTLLRPTLVGLLRLGWLNQMTQADTEIPWYGKRIDLAFVPSSDSARPVAVELKVGDTRRAIEQAALNRYVAPASWVAVASAPSSRLLSLAEDEGVGVLLIADPGVYPLIRPCIGEPHGDDLLERLQRARRVRDILSELRHG